MKTPDKNHSGSSMKTAASPPNFVWQLLLLLVWQAGCSAKQQEEDPQAGSAASDLQFASPTILGRPLVTDDSIYVGNADGTVYSVDITSARINWTFDTDGAVFNSPAIYRDLILVGSRDGQLRALKKASGELVWSFQSGDVDWDVRDIFVNGIPAVIDDMVVFSSEDFNVYALDAATGAERWRHSLGEEPQAREMPIVDNTAFVGAWDGYLYAIDVQTGNRRWRSTTDDNERASKPNQVPFVTTVPIIDGNAVYFSDWAGNLYCVDRNTGKQRWRFDTNAIDSRHVGSRSYIALHDGVVYFSTVEDKHLYGIDAATGREVWKKEFDGVVYGPANAEGSIGLYFEELENANGEISTTMHVIDFGTRENLWSTDDGVYLPTIKDGVVYYAHARGTIIGRNLEDGSIVFTPGD